VTEDEPPRSSEPVGWPGGTLPIHIPWVTSHTDPGTRVAQDLSDEIDMLVTFLDYLRESVLSKLGGCSGL